MTPEEARRGCVEVMLPQGGCVKVEFSDELAANPELEAQVVRMLLDAEGSDGDIGQALVDYAETSGLGARFFLGSRDLLVEIFDVPRGRRPAYPRGRPFPRVAPDRPSGRPSRV